MHDRREKIYGIDDGQIGSQAENAGVVGCLGPDNDFWMIKLWETVQYLHQVGRAELGSSTGRLDLLR